MASSRGVLPLHVCSALQGAGVAGTVQRIELPTQQGRRRASIALIQACNLTGGLLDRCRALWFRERSRFNLPSIPGLVHTKVFDQSDEEKDLRHRWEQRERLYRAQQNYDAYNAQGGGGGDGAG